jgi:hypothetical protein
VGLGASFGGAPIAFFKPADTTAGGNCDLCASACCATVVANGSPTLAFTTLALVPSDDCEGAAPLKRPGRVEKYLKMRKIIYIVSE